MTKVTILGQEPKEVKKLKPIEFVRAINPSGIGFNEEPCFLPNQMEEIQVIKRQGLLEFDIFYCKLKPQFYTHGSHCVYLGHFNDGVVSND